MMYPLIWFAGGLVIGAGAYAIWRWWHRPVRFPDPLSNHHEARERFPERKS